MKKFQFWFLISLVLGFLPPAFSLAHADEGEGEIGLTGTLPPSEDQLPLPAGITEKIGRDWADQRTPLLAQNSPDHSMKTVWVRMFPLLNVPYGDPYSNSQNIYHAQLQNTPGFSVYSLQTQKLLGTGTNLLFDFSRGSFALNGHAITTEALWIVPTTPQPSQLNWDSGLRSATGVRLRGGFVVQKTGYGSRSLWSVTNVINIDQYIQSVAASEAYYTWLPAALQAQAIAARTYLAYQMATARAANRNWDLDPSTAFQSYRGVQYLQHGSWSSTEQDSTNAAALTTSGQVITYNGEIIIAYFSANSGGVTCSASECMGTADQPYLKSVPDAPGVQGVGGGTWGARISSSSIIRTLSRMRLLPAKTNSAKLTPLQVGPSGRIWRLRVLLNRGAVDLTTGQTGIMMGLFGAIRSHLFQVGSVSQGAESVVGHGYGHGVGMSQWGAQLFAQSGWTAAQILSHFYSNTAIEDITVGRLP